MIYGHTGGDYCEARREEGGPVTEICRKMGISQVTFLNWQKKYAGLMPSVVKPMRELEDGNNRLK